MSASESIKFLAIMRAGDKKIVSTYAHPKVISEDRTKYLEISQRVVAAPNWTQEVGANSRHALEFDSLKLHFMLDSESYVYFGILSGDYPVRVAHLMLNELQATFTAKFKSHVSSLKPGQMLGKDCVKMLNAIAIKYNDLASVDKLAKVKQQVDDVKDTMKDSINIALSNTEKMDTLSEKVNNLADSASIFKKGAKDVRRQMWLKNLKLTLAICFLVILAILVLLYALGIFDQKSSTTSNKLLRH